MPSPRTTPSPAPYQLPKSERVERSAARTSGDYSQAYRLAVNQSLGLRPLALQQVVGALAQLPCFACRGEASVKRVRSQWPLFLTYRVGIGKTLFTP